MAIRHNRYNAKALVNKGNCLFMSKEYGRAKEIFLEAIGVEASILVAVPRCHPIGVDEDALRRQAVWWRLTPAGWCERKHERNAHRTTNETISTAATYNTPPGVAKALAYPKVKLNVFRSHHFYRKRLGDCLMHNILYFPTCTANALMFCGLPAYMCAQWLFKSDFGR